MLRARSERTQWIMEYRRFGTLREKVSVIGFGTWAIGGPTVFGGREIGWGRTNVREATRAIRLAVALGINFFDTADIYGRGKAEEILGRALRATPDAILCTKFGNREDSRGRAAKDFSPRRLRESVEASLRRLRRETIDILLLHSPPDDFDWSRYDPTALERLKRAGKIRMYGVSSRSVRGALCVLEHRFGEVLEVVYNALDRRAARTVLPKAHQRGWACIARVPLASGFLTSERLGTLQAFEPNDIRAQLSASERQWRIQAVEKLRFLASLSSGMACSALRFCFSHDGISTVIPGMRSRAQVEENVAAGELGALPASVLVKIARAVPRPYSGWRF